MIGKIFLLLIVIFLISVIGCKQENLVVPDQYGSNYGENYDGGMSPNPQATEKVVEVGYEDIKPADVTTEQALPIVKVMRNPFLTIAEAKSFGDDYREELQYLNLTAVFYSTGSSYAVIDGRIVRENDIVDNKKVIAFGPEKVFLQDSVGKEYVVKVRRIINEE